MVNNHLPVAGSDEYSLWVEEMAYRLGFDRVLGPEYAPYLFVITVLFIDVPILSTLSYVLRPDVTYHAAVDFPLWPLIPIVLLTAVWGMRRIQSQYTRAVRTAGRRSERDAKRIKVATPTHFRTTLYVMVLILYLIAWGPFFPEAIASEGPIVGSIKWLGLIPFFYLPIVVEFFVVYLHGLFFLPVTIYLSETPLDFADPEKLGGMGPVGTLIISATKIYYLVLILWTGMSFLRRLLAIQGATESGPEPVSMALFVVTWIMGGVLFLLAMFAVHLHMAQQRREKVTELTEGIRQAGTDEEMFPYAEPSDDKEVMEYVQQYMNLDRVESTHTYPADVSNLWELFGVAVLPVLLQVGSLVLEDLPLVV